MITDTEGLIDFMGNHDMNPSQFMLCWILHLDKVEYGDTHLPTQGDFKAKVYKYKDIIGPWRDEDILDLEERGYLVNKGKGENYYPDEMEVTDKFTKAMSEKLSSSREHFPVKVTPVETSVIDALSLPPGSKKVQSSEVESIQQGDVIISMNETELKQEDTLQQEIKKCSPGDTVQAKILRNGESQRVSFAVGR